MPRLAPAILVLSVGFGSGACAQMSDRTAKPQAYFATEVGTRSVYRIVRNGVQWDESRVVTEVEETKQGKLVTITATRERDEFAVPVVDGKPQKPRRVTDRSNKRYLLAADGIFWLGEVSDKQPDIGPVCYLKLPPHAGAKWSFEYPQYKTQGTNTICKSERIKVLAGTFDAISIDLRSSFDGKPNSPRKDWYAEGVGLIKLEMEHGNWTEELTSIERPPQFTRPAGPEEIFKKAIAARGSKDGPYPNDMAHTLGEGTLFKGNEEIPITVEQWNFGPSRRRTEMTKTTSKGKITDVAVFDRGSAWSKHGDQPAEAVRGDDLETFKRTVESEELTLQQVLDDKGVQLSMAGERFRDNEPCWCVRVRRKGAPDYVYSFSKKTFLLKADSYLQKSGDGEVSIETVYADHRKVQDTLVAYRQEMFEDLQIRSRTNLKKIELIETVDEKLLAMPK